MGALSSLRRDMKGGTKSYKKFVDQRNKWVEAQLKKLGLVDPVSWTSTGEGGGEPTVGLTKEQKAALAKVPGGPGWEHNDGGFVPNPEYTKLQRKFEAEQYKKSAQFQEQSKKLQAQWLDTLPPADKTKALNEFKLHSSDLGTINKYGSMATKALLTTIAGGAALTAGGVLGGTGAAGGAGGTGAAGGGISAADAAAEAGLGYGGYGGAGGTVAGQGGLLGGTSIASGASPLGGLGVDIASGIGAAGSALGGAGGSSGGGLLDLVSKAGDSSGGDLLDLVSKAGGAGMDFLKNMGGADWLKALLAGGGLANDIFNKEDYPDSPDFMKLSKEQQDLNMEGWNKTLQANRPNQVDAQGNTLKWIQDPTTGQWTQTVDLSAANKGLQDSRNQALQDSLNQINEQGVFNPTGLMSIMDPVGNSSDIQNAWMNLLQPQRDQARQKELIRLKNQGLSENSPAFQRALLTLGQGDTDAQNKALIAGTTEYGNQFNRSLLGNREQFGQAKDIYAAPTNRYSGLMGAGGPQTSFERFNTATGAPVQDIYGAAQDEFTAKTGGVNFNNASSNNISQGLYGLAGAFGNQPPGAAPTQQKTPTKTSFWG